MSDFEWVAAALVSIFATARITRLFVWDLFPPAVWVRDQWDGRTGMRDHNGELVRNENGDVLGHWTPLLHCGYCFGVWAAAPVMLSGWLSDWHTAWWLVCGWLAISYLGAIVMAYDGED